MPKLQRIRMLMKKFNNTVPRFPFSTSDMSILSRYPEEAFPVCAKLCKAIGGSGAWGRTAGCKWFSHREF